MSPKRVIVQAVTVEPKVIFTKAGDKPSAAQFAMALCNSDTPVVGTADELRSLLANAIEEVDRRVCAMVLDVDPLTISSAHDIIHLTAGPNASPEIGAAL